MAIFVYSVSGHVCVQADTEAEAAEFADDWAVAVSEGDMYFLGEARDWGLQGATLNVNEDSARVVRRSGAVKFSD